MDEVDNPAKTCLYIPPSEPESRPSQSLYNMSNYRKAWCKCLNRIRAILKELHAPVVKAVVHEILHAHDGALPGLPYPELPVVALTGTNSTLLSEVMLHLRSPRQGNGGVNGNSADFPIRQVHLYPADCSTIMNMMKLIVTGFVDQTPGRKRQATSLASSDINLLLAWFVAQDRSPRLAVFLHEFEKFDPSVVQDVFYISSLHVPKLPLTFVLVMNSPPSPSFLHTAYSRSTLAVLRVHKVSSPAELATVKQVLTKTFFDPDFEPDIMIGASALEYIVEFAGRHTASPDALITMLQLVYMKHFSQPLSVFVQDELLGTETPHEAEHTLVSSLQLHPLVDAVHSRILAASQDQEQLSRAPQNASGLLACVSTARVIFYRRIRRMRTAFAVVRLAEHVALGDAPQDIVSEKAAEGRASRLDSLETLSAVLRGRVGPQVRYACMAVRKLPASRLRDLLRDLHSFWSELRNNAIRRDEEEARTWVVQTLYDLPEPVEEAQDADVPDARLKQLAVEVGDWLQQYIEERLLVRLEDCLLWDVWYTGTAPFPSELINPAPRPTVVAALLHPHDFVRAHTLVVRANARHPAEANSSDAAHSDTSQNDRALWELPDTSIAFRRFFEAGRMVNVFDWFESFAVVLESQRRYLRRRTARAESVSTPTRGKGKARAVSREDFGADDNEEIDEEEEEHWKVEVQARFIRALHELDYMGFVRHTGRKADHVIRTTYDIPD